MAHPSKPRLEFLDWARGIAATIMLQGHVFDAFATGEQRQSSPFILSQFLGGMPPALFLFLTGVTLSFLFESQERKELSAWARLRGVAFRARYLLLMALAFRIQLWAFAWPYAAWTDLLKVDILNCMGAAILLLSPLALLGRLDRIRYSLLAGLAIAGASPLIANLDWSGAPELLRNYLVPNPALFPLFPWAAFVAFGVTTGTILKMASSRDLGRFAQWAALAGLVLVFGGQKLADIPYSLYPKSDFWIDSPWLVLIKTGLALLLLAIAYLWTSYVSSGWSWVRQLGTSSLLVYWVHTELVYGRWLYPLKGTLSIPQIALLAVTVILSMIGLTVVWRQAPQWWEMLTSRSGRLAANPAEGD
jgi:uncharacterized membrane protein